jgi:nucleoside-diphosphate-sugar epimerase
VTDRVVVIGGSGFIGKRVVAALAACGWAQPVIASRRPVGSTDGAEHVHVEATDAAALAPVLRDAAFVVNCVAGNSNTIVANARALFTAAARCTPQPRVIYLSSMAVYGSASGIVTESTPLVNDSPYSGAKIAAEGIAATYSRAIILRPGIVYGPHSPWWSMQIARLLRARRLGDLGRLGQGICNLLYVEDMAKAVLRTLREPTVEGHTYNLAMADPPTWNEYFATYAQALGVAPSQVSAPRLALELHLLGPALRALQVGVHLTHLPFQTLTPIRPWLIRLTQHEIKLDVSAAERELRMTWTPLTVGLRETASWHGAAGKNHAFCPARGGGGNAADV